MPADIIGHVTPLATAIPDPFALLAAIDARCTNRDSHIHGPVHWRGVAHVGLRLALGTAETDPVVVLLFAMLHDTMRVNDGHDPEHGPRAADFAATLQGEHFHLSGVRLKWLIRAIRDHTTGQRGPSATVACCWDADRLNLWRIGVRPDPKYLTTPAAAHHIAIDGARELVGERKTWGEIIEAYRAAVGG